LVENLTYTDWKSHKPQDMDELSGYKILHDRLIMMTIHQRHKMIEIGEEKDASEGSGL